MSKFKKILLLTTASFGLLFLFVISELIYIYNNKPEYIAVYNLWLAKATATQNPYKSLRYLEKSTMNEAQATSKLIGNNMPEYIGFNIEFSQLNDKFISEYLNFISNISPYQVAQKSYYSAKIFYSVGLIAAKNDESEFSKKLFNASMYADPELSYYAVELANAYLLNGNTKESKEIIDNCVKFGTPKKHCEEYLTSHINDRSPQPIGFLEKIIYESE